MQIPNNLTRVGLTAEPPSAPPASEQGEGEQLQDLDVNDGADDVVGGLKLTGDPDEGGEFQRMR